MILNLLVLLIGLPLPYLCQDKLNLDALNNYSEFLNFGEKKWHDSSKNRENAIFKSKLDVLGEVFKKSVQFFKVSTKLDIVFLVDASSSVGSLNFKSELKFIKKLLSDITVDYNHTRVAVVTFSSPSDTVSYSIYYSTSVYNDSYYSQIVQLKYHPAIVRFGTKHYSKLRGRNNVIVK